VRDKGWEALPLAPAELSRLLPELWGTEKAAEAWLGNNPLIPGISIIRLWGGYCRLPAAGRRGRWSKALIRVGADARAVLAEVLGVAAGDLVLREGAGSEALVSWRTPTASPPRASSPPRSPMK
jgi:hypothetical protein